MFRFNEELRAVRTQRRTHYAESRAGAWKESGVWTIAGDASYTSLTGAVSRSQFHDDRLALLGAVIQLDAEGKVSAENERAQIGPYVALLRAAEQAGKSGRANSVTGMDQLHTILRGPGTDAAAIQAYEDNTQCPLCLDPATDPTFTRCLHLFCCKCILVTIPASIQLANANARTYVTAEGHRKQMKKDEAPCPKGRKHQCHVRGSTEYRGVGRK